ncbi:AMP-binding protein [Candidatus Solincola tengchongensis]|uniref:class I adenylate-forming enzyme family protein n=1 Tax=Candidatus Solincola tengchongensis TaxID=2900693 RepID=UPI00258034BA|nr:AMP-binding protein [Candidatus Solincola tengchongensis]
MEGGYRPQGVKRRPNYPRIPVFQMLRSSAAQWPGRNALVFGGMELTFRELDLLSDRFAAALADMGVHKGDRVGIHLPNCPQFAVAYYGLLKAGAVFVPLDHLLSERELLFQLRDAEVETYLGLDMTFRMPRRILPRTPVRRVILTSLADCYPRVSRPVKPLRQTAIPPQAVDFSELLSYYPEEPPDITFDVKKDLAHIVYTGGVAGRELGVMTTHYNVVSNCCQFAQWFLGGEVSWRKGRLVVRRPPGGRPEDHVMRRGAEVSLIVVPWTHVMGIVAFFNIQVMNGWTMIVSARFDPEQYLLDIGKYGATGFGGPPQLFVPLMECPGFNRKNLEGIRLVVSGAAPLEPQLLRRLMRRIPGVVCEGYGLTECTMGCTANPPSRQRVRPGSVGLPLPDTEIRLVDPLDGRTPVKEGETGEILVRGPQVTPGYWRKPEETARVFRDGWLYTGDLGRMDGDGYLYLVGRKKDMLICKGFNVFPRELEEVLRGHHAVAGAVVVGKRDARYGEVPVAYVQLKAGESAEPGELLDYANRRLARYKRIRELHVVEELSGHK